MLRTMSRLAFKISWRAGEGIVRSGNRVLSQSYSNNKVWTYLLVGLPLLFLAFFMYIIFAPVQGETKDISLQAFTTNAGDYSTSKSTFIDTVNKNEGGQLVSQAQSRVFPDVITNISFNPKVSAKVKALNTEAYRVTYKYFNKSIVKNIPPQWADPLIIMALGDVETSGYINTKELWTPVLPDRALTNITPSMIDTFGIEDIINDPSYWDIPKNSSPAYQGPLQMSLNYGVYDAMIPSDLHGSERTRSSETLVNKYPGFNVGLLIEMNQSINTGDRFNWPDAANRTSGQMDHIYGEYLKDSQIKKTGMYAIDNRYSFAAIVAMAHNTGAGVLTLPDGVRAGSWSKAEMARRYANVLGKADVVSIIKTAVDSNVKRYRSGGPLYVRAPNSVLSEVYNYIYTKGYLPRDYLNGVYKENKDYPIHALYAYITLEELYSGG